ncbi:MAG: selenium-binding protein SBP56-related protein, partial [Planctomycetaceae bacterium]
MKRRDFLKTTAAATAGVMLPGSRVFSADHQHEHHHHGACYASPKEAMKSPRETLLYVTALYAGTETQRPDYLATVDVDVNSPTYSRVIHRLEMPNVGDELHHFGWNACSSCRADGVAMRRYLLIPGLRSGRIHVADVSDPSAPRLHTVIEAETIREKTNLSAPHTVHCLPDGHIMISMLGDGEGNAPGGFLLLDSEFNVAGRWEKNAEGMNFNYDFWYQPRHGVMVSSEWAAPNTVRPGFKLEDVQAGKYGRHLHFWDWEKRTLNKSVDLGEQGMIPLEVRFHHDPESHHGFVGAALSSTMWHWHKPGDEWQVDKVIDVQPIEVAGWPFPVPGLITDLLLSMDDRFLYFSNWLHGDVRQYDVSDPAEPKLVGQVWCGGVTGQEAGIGGKKLAGGPQMLQLSLDGKRLYVTNSLYSSWDNQFYPDIAKRGSLLLRIDADTEKGGLTLN